MKIPLSAISAALRVDMELTDFECLLVGENSILLVSAIKTRLLKLQDVDHERDARQLKPTIKNDISGE